MGIVELARSDRARSEIDIGQGMGSPRAAGGCLQVTRPSSAQSAGSPPDNRNQAVPSGRCGSRSSRSGRGCGVKPQARNSVDGDS